MHSALSMQTPAGSRAPCDIANLCDPPRPDVDFLRALACSSAAARWARAPRSSGTRRSAVKALARSQLLALVNASDGLDVPSRETLKELISHTLLGFGQLLVQGVDASATARTQVLLLTHREEEIVPEVATVSWLPDKGRRAAQRAARPIGAPTNWCANWCANW